MFKLSRLYEAMDDAFNIRYYRMTKQKKQRKPTAIAIYYLQDSVDHY